MAKEAHIICAVGQKREPVKLVVPRCLEKSWIQRKRNANGEPIVRSKESMKRILDLRGKPSGVYRPIKPHPGPTGLRERSPESTAADMCRNEEFRLKLSINACKDLVSQTHIKCF